jgi:hypothetical protein
VLAVPACAAQNARHQTGVSVSLRLALALLTLSSVSAVVAAEDPTQRVIFESGKNSAALAGTVTGYRSLRYLIAGHAGQVLSTSFAPSKKSLYYNVLQGSHMLRDGSSEDSGEWSATLAADGDYVIDVYLKSSDARKNVEATFTLAVTISNTPAK